MHGRQRTRLVSATPLAIAALAALSMIGCTAKHAKGSTPTTVSPGPGSTGTVVTVGLGSAKNLTLDQFVARFSHDPQSDRNVLANNGFVSADFDADDTSAVVLMLHFQGRDGASETMTTLVNDAKRRKDAASFDVGEVPDASGVRWTEQGRSTGTATIEQVVFVRGTVLVIVEATRPPGTTDTAAVRARAKRAS